MQSTEKSVQEKEIATEKLIKEKEIVTEMLKDINITLIKGYQHTIELFNNQY